MRISKWQKGSMLLGVLVLLIHWFMPAPIVELVHGKFIFPLISWLLDHSINLLPFSIIYLLVPLAFYGLFRLISGLIRQGLSTASSWITFLIRILSLTGVMIGVFYIFWGFNYDRLQLIDRVPWSIAPISKVDFLQEGRDQVSRLLDFSTTQREAISANVSYLHFRLLETIMRKEALSIATTLGYLDRKRVRCRQLAPKGVLLRIATAGFYNPLTGECNIDKGLHPLQKPFVMAHELFHGMGVTGEGDCNFLAYVLCHQSKVDYIRYSGELSYWRYMRHTLRKTDGVLYSTLVSELPQFVIEDLEAIDEVILKYPDIAPDIRDAIYNAYLRSNKIDDGMANYNRILELVVNWEANGRRLK